MRILYYLHQFPAIGGIETVTAALSNAFVARGYEVTIVSHIDQQRMGSGIALDERVTVLHMPNACNVSARNRDFLQRVITDKRIEVVVYQDSYSAIEQNLFPVECAVKVITVEHSEPCFTTVCLERYSFIHRVLWHIRHPFWNVRRAAYERNRRRYLYDVSDRYVLLSSRFFGEYRTMTGLVDTKKLRAMPNPLASELRVESQEKKNEIVFCATLSGLKGCDMLLRAWQRIEHKCDDWQLTIVGDGPDRVMLEKLRDELRLERCMFEGYREDPAPYFARAKVFAFPSRREGWGLVLVEAMVNGCVPVAFDSYGAVHDIIDDELNGFIVPAFDLDCFSQALLKLTEDDECVSSMSEQAKRKAAGFDLVKIADRWESLIADISK